MIIVQGHARFASGTAAAHHDALAAMVTATRIEDGCELYAFAFDALDPNVMHITERWRDQAALDAHGSSVHMAAFRQAISAAAPMEFKVALYSAAGPLAR